MKSSFSAYASIVLDVSIHKTLDYGIPESLLGQVKRGVRVAVPVRGSTKEGCVFEVKESPDFASVKGIKAVLSDGPILSEDLFDLALWISKYYGASLRQVLKIMIPSSLREKSKPKEQLFVSRKKSRPELQPIAAELRKTHPKQAAVLDVLLKVTKGLFLSELIEEAGVSKSPIETLCKKGFIAVEPVQVDRSPLDDAEYFRSQPKVLHDEQKKAFDLICKDLDQESFATHLLHGITGSGKTEIYLQAIERVRKSGKGSLMLVPEISLTTQMIERFRSRFEDQIAILHHRLSHGERFDEWKRIQRGDAPIVIGARSAVFSPIPNLGLIIVDEEHEGSYKQTEESPCYHARDVAVMRSHLTNSVCILGSATPSLESYTNAKNGKYILSELQTRAEESQMPAVNIVDMKREFERAKGFVLFSDPLISALQKRFEQGEQSILFLNRRGYHTSLLCTSCGEAIGCDQCDVSLTYHKSSHMLSCHLCGEVKPPPKQCPSCNSDQTLQFKGVGTEMVERSLHAILPDIRTLRMDADTTKHKGSHQKLLREFGTGKADVLIGTQMIAKGLHFPEVTLVGILNCDQTLNLPDFRASETAFQLMTQVAGRSGRGVIAGEVLIQTCLPDNPTIAFASEQNYKGFYEEEIAVRELFDYPPLTHLMKLSFSGENEQEVEHWALQIRTLIIKQLPPSFECLPVCPAGHLKVQNRYRYQFLVKGNNVYRFNSCLDAVLHKKPVPRTVRLKADIDPLSTFF